nr:MAG TPA: hypothetical protein [Caudoviricetes sp.]
MLRLTRPTKRLLRNLKTKKYEHLPRNIQLQA